jgi:hypothetical protein
MRTRQIRLPRYSYETLVRSFLSGSRHGKSCALQHEESIQLAVGVRRFSTGPEEAARAAKAFV